MKTCNRPTRPVCYVSPALDDRSFVPTNSSKVSFSGTGRRKHRHNNRASRHNRIRT